EDALIDQDHPAAFVAVPAEIRLGDRKLRVGKRPKPFRVNRDSFTDRANHLLGIVGMFGKGDATHLHRPCLAKIFLIAGAAQEREIARAAGHKVYLLESVVPLRDRRYLSGAANLLIA